MELLCAVHIAVQWMIKYWNRDKIPVDPLSGEEESVSLVDTGLPRTRKLKKNLSW